MKIKIYADGADYKSIIRLNKSVNISGFTTNPTLMRKSGIKDYSFFAKKVLKQVKNKPISFEVFSDDFQEMKKQARIINSWGSNVYVKIPICNTKGVPSTEVIRSLSYSGIKLNVTAVLTYQQAITVIKNLDHKVPSIISIFAGRIADTGRDPTIVIRKIINYLNYKRSHKISILWASTRELYNIFQATKAGCSIITIPNNILDKISMINNNLNKLTVETVKMFREDAIKSKFKI